MIVKKDKGWMGYYYIHEESNLTLAHDSWEYSFNIRYSINWLREHRKSLTFIKNQNDKKRKENI